MFVLCPHCHFLVGMDPRSGRPPAACPKCHGMLAEPAPAAATDAVATPATLDPFAEATLPSVAPAPVEEAAVAVDAPVGADAAPAPATAGVDEPAPPEETTAPERAAPDVAEAGAPRADAMIAALAARPTRKPRPPRTRERKPRTAAPVAAPGDGDAAAAVPAEGSATPTPVTAATTPTLGARLRRWFGRARPSPEAQPAAPTPASEAADAATSSAPRASGAPPSRVHPLSIRNRRKRGAATTQPTQAPAETAPAPSSPVIPDASASPAGVASAAPPATAVGTGAIDAMPGEAAPAMATPDRPVTEPEAGPPESIVSPAGEAASATDTGVAAGTSVPAASAPASPMTPPTTAATPRRPAPSFATVRSATRPPRRDLRTLAAASGLALLLALQLLFAQRDTLAADAQWRPTIATLCSVLRCQLPPWREPAAFTMLSRHVRPHPDAPGTLQVDASFRNDARWPQPWPRLQLSLADIDGRVVGARSFAPAEYLGAAPSQPMLAPGQTAAISLAVVEPAPDIVAFSFDFR